MTQSGWIETVLAAKKLAKQIGVAYAVQWPSGILTVENRKPMLRSHDMKVIECLENGTEQHA